MDSRLWRWLLVAINKELIEQLLMFGDPYVYEEKIILYPVLMSNVVPFNIYSQSITVRKDSTFPEKKIIKMPYLQFLYYCSNNKELAEKYNIFDLPNWYRYAMRLLKLVCQTDNVRFDLNTGNFYIENIEVNYKMFDDIRRIIILQNEISFDIDEFLHYEAEQALIDSSNKLNQDKITLEDQIDSLIIQTHYSEQDIKNLTIRRFNRLLRRINMRDDFIIAKEAEMGGMVKFKNPIKHWMISIEKQDKYSDVKTDSKSFNELKGKIES
jgi:hypothetical protein